MSISQLRLIQKNRFFWHKLAALEGSGAPNSFIAKILGCTVQKVEKHVAYPAYIEFRNAKTQKRESAFDREFSKVTSTMISEMSELIPKTIRVYEEAMQKGLEDPRYLASAVKAADSINDRVGVLVRQSTQIHELRVPQAELERARATAKALKARQAQQEQVIEGELISEVPALPSADTIPQSEHPETALVSDTHIES